MEGRSIRTRAKSPTARTPLAPGVTLSSPPDLYVYDYDWAPDGKSFAAEAAKGSGTNNYWLAELYVVDRASGAALSVRMPGERVP